MRRSGLSGLLERLAARISAGERTLPSRPPSSGAASPHPLRLRLGVLVLAVAVPAIAAPGSGLEHLARSPEGDPRPGVARSVMPFEEPGMSFPGSAFYYLADPPERAALIALPAADPLAEPPAPAPLDPGPAAAPFLAASASPRAADCLAEAVFYEAASESEAGQRAVAQVVLNRVRHAAWPNSVCGVVFEGSQRATGCQFSFTCDGSRARTPRGPAWARARRIAGAALAGEVYAPIGLATHYHTLWVAPRWAASLDPVGTIGAHVFYRARGNAGQLAAFDEAYDGAHEGVRPGASARAPAPQAGARSPAPSGPAEPAALPALAAAGQREPDAAAPAPSAEPAQGSGSVRAEYRSAGSWKARPEKRAPAPRIAVEPLAPVPAAPASAAE